MKTNMTLVAFAFSMATLFAGGTVLAADKVSADAAIAAANAAKKEASLVGGEWRDTGKIIKKAEKAAASGDYESAIKLANKAESQGKLGKTQAMIQKNNWN